MKNRCKNLFICILLVIIVFLSVFIMQLYIKQPTFVTLWEPCVTQEETAIGIAQSIVKEHTGLHFEKEKFIATENETTWTVKLKNRQDYGENVFATDSSGIRINKQDGTIISILIEMD